MLTHISPLTQLYMMQCTSAHMQVWISSASLHERVHVKMPGVLPMWLGQVERGNSHLPAETTGPEKHLLWRLLCQLGIVGLFQPIPTTAQLPLTPIRETFPNFTATLIAVPTPTIFRGDSPIFSQGPLQSGGPFSAEGLLLSPFSKKHNQLFPLLPTNTTLNSKAPKLHHLRQRPAATLKGTTKCNMGNLVGETRAPVAEA